MDRCFIPYFFKTMSEENKLKFAGTMSSSELAILVAETYLAWLDMKRHSTTDEVFQMGLNFIHVITLYRLFKKALRAGDAIMIEWLYQKFLALFLVTKKSHYVEIVLSDIDQFYRDLPYHLLHLVRINRTVPLHDGVDSGDVPMANHALDDIIEILQKYYHKFSFESSLHNSPNLMMFEKAL